MNAKMESVSRELISKRMKDYERLAVRVRQCAIVCKFLAYLLFASFGLPFVFPPSLKFLLGVVVWTAFLIALTNIILEKKKKLDLRRIEARMMLARSM